MEEIRCPNCGAVLNQMESYDMLYPDGIKFKKMCEEKQIKLKFTEKKKMMHVYPILPVKEAKEALKDILEIINEN